MFQANWILLLISVIYFTVAFMIVKNPLARRNYLFVATIFLIVGVSLTLMNFLRR